MITHKVKVETTPKKIQKGHIYRFTYDGGKEVFILTINDKEGIVIASDNLGDLIGNVWTALQDPKDLGTLTHFKGTLSLTQD